MLDSDVPIRPAATAILLRHRAGHVEVLLLHRNSELIFGGDHWVFPGGRIDTEDYCGADREDHDAAARIAAVRETREETGLHIVEALLTPVSRWTTPSPSPKRYNTAFFATIYPGNQDVVVDGSEIVAHQWLQPATAIEHYHNGDKKMMPPTLHTLYEIARHPGAEDYIALCAGRSPLIFDP